MQKFVKETTKKKLVIPYAVLELSGLEKGDPVEIRTMDDAVVILRSEMTAMELIRAIDSLQNTVLDLTAHLVNVCGPCKDCSGSGGEECPADPSRTAMMIPDELRKEVHIPIDAKLCAWIGDTPGTVVVGQADYRYDLTDVPAWILEILASQGVCIGKLEDRLMEEDAVYG